MAPCTLFGTLLSADVAMPERASTTESLFGLLDNDVLMAIVRHLLWQPQHPATFRAMHLAAKDLASLLQTCRFWKEAIYASGNAERLEAAALAAGCVPTETRDADNRHFRQLLKQVRSSIHVALLETAIQLMVTHCALPHCSGAFVALQSYSTSVLSVDAHSARYAGAQHALTRRALEGVTIRLAVAQASHVRYGITSAQGPRGDAPGGVLLASAPTHDVATRSFVYVHASEARVFSPTSSLRRGATITPKVEVYCSAVCGDAIVLCHRTGPAVEGLPLYQREHAISVWSSELGTLLSTSSARKGAVAVIWVAPGTSTDKGDFLEVYTLVGSRTRSPEQHDLLRQAMGVSVDRYALATKEWSATQSTPIHLASARHYGVHWRYYSAGWDSSEATGVRLWDSSTASESPLGRVALSVSGWMGPLLENDPFDETAEGRYVRCYRHRTLVVGKRARVNMCMFDSVLPLEVEEIQKIQKRWTPSVLDVENTVEEEMPEPHISRCGNVLVTVPEFETAATKRAVHIYTFHPERGWVLQARHSCVDVWHNKPLPDFAKGLTAFSAEQEHPGLQEFMSLTHSVEERGWGWPGRWKRSSFSPCGKYLMLLYRFHVLVVDVHESLCHGRLRVRFVLVNGQTRPHAISWIDGLFVQTGHGVQHVGTYPTDSPRS